MHLAWIWLFTAINNRNRGKISLSVSIRWWRGQYSAVKPLIILARETKREQKSIRNHRVSLLIPFSHKMPIIFVCYISIYTFSIVHLSFVSSFFLSVVGISRYTLGRSLRENNIISRKKKEKCKKYIYIYEERYKNRSIHWNHEKRSRSEASVTQKWLHTKDVSI